MTNFSVKHYSGDFAGGASRAAYRLHKSLLKSNIVNSSMLVSNKKIDEHSIESLKNNFSNNLLSLIKSTIDLVPLRIAKPIDNLPRSTGLASKISAANINSSDIDIVHLHWINSAFLSIEEISKVKKPIVWTFHDMWPFCGGEHLTSDSSDARWRNGYKQSNSITGFDVDRWVWNRKKKYFNNPIHIITPSKWLANCVRESSLFNTNSVHVIPNTLDTNVYKPVDKIQARKLLNLPENKQLLLFGAIKGTQLNYKGWDLLQPCLSILSKKLPNMDIVIFGQSEPKKSSNIPMKIHWMGHLHDDYTLAALYSACDVLVIPSRQESFGQTGSEAQACGCPVVAFNTTGLKDVIDNDVTGLLVKPFDTIEMSNAIFTIISNESLRAKFSVASRNKALLHWGYETISSSHIKLYQDILSL